MRLKEFIENNPKNTKIIITNKVSVGNALIRTCNIREGVPSFNIISKTPFDLAKEILNAGAAEQINYLSPEGSAYLMMNVLRDMKSEMFPESTLTIGTSKEVVLRINELRENGMTDAYQKAVNQLG